MHYECIPTTCTYCGCGCSIVLQVLDGILIGMLPSKSNPINDGSLCIKGWTSHEFVYHEKRLKNPLMKRDGVFVESSWEEALAMVAGKLRKIKEESGADSIAALSSAKCTNEENYLMQKFVRAAIGTNNIDHCARL
jgi:predicted molibdopterin-dependent oxidoreductase YjgC